MVGSVSFGPLPLDLGVRVLTPESVRSASASVHSGVTRTPRSRCRGGRTPHTMYTTGSIRRCLENKSGKEKSVGVDRASLWNEQTK